MVRQIHLKEVHELNESQVLGYFPKEEDFDEIINEDCDVYLPDGKLAIAYRKGAIRSLVDIEEDRYEYWRWVSKTNPSIGRGAAAGKEIYSHKWRRVTKGQRNFFKQAMKGKHDESTLEQIRELVDANPEYDVMNYVVGTVRADKLYDVEMMRPYEKKLNKIKKLPRSEQEELIKFFEENRNIWFWNWMESVFIPAPAEKRSEVALKSYQRYLGRESYNEVYSNVAGAMDRQVMVPYARLTVCVKDQMEKFEKEKPFFKEVDKLFQHHMPEEHKFLESVFKSFKDERYNLFGTSFSSITVNNNFQVAYHRDGNNCKGGIAVITSINRGEYEGYDFIFPQFRLGFKIRDADFICGDNQKYIHGMMPMTNATDDAESIWFVFYLREGLKYAEEWDCEQCRRTFMSWCTENMTKESNQRGTWNGIWPNMWHSKEWEDYKASKGLEHCTMTNHNGK